MRIASLFCTLLCLAGAVGPAACQAADNGPWAISVAAGDIDRSNLPAAAEGGAAVLIKLAGKPVVRYEMPTYDTSSAEKRLVTDKPFHHLFDPVTGMRLTKGDGGQFTHHRGIFFGYNRISHGSEKNSMSDCWHCAKGARQERRLMLDEIRELEIVPTPGGTSIDFASRLTADYQKPAEVRAIGG